MKVLILAGDLGTRLRGVVDDKPKPMVRVRSKPFLKYLLLQLKQFGFEDIFLPTGYLAGKSFLYLYRITIRMTESYFY